MAFSIPYPIYFIIILILLPFSTIAQTYRNITLGSSLTANNNNNSSWTSPSGDFAFGFQQIGTGGYLLAIWFDQIPEKTIVWSANRDNLVQEGSEIQLTRAGRFVLNDPNGQQIWAANLAGSRVNYAAMLDSGNFVLSSNDSTTLWQSFEEPTDTILPMQTWNLDTRLLSSFSSTNYSNGRFEFRLQSDGNLVFYTRKYPLDAVNFAYWATDTVGSGFQLIFNQSGYVYLTASNGTVLNLVLSNAASTRQLYQRVVLDFDGVLRQYVYPKSTNSTGGRSMAWSILSSAAGDICTRIRQDTGGGACGFNSYCTMGNEQRPQCQCPSGYTSIDPNDELGGCKPNFVPQNCDAEAQETDLFEFIDMANTDWPLSDYEFYQRVNEDWCREICLSDCFCAAAIFRDGNCWKKKIPLSNGRMNPSVGGKALIKIRKDNSTPNSTNAGSKKKDQSTVIITGSVLLGSSVFLNLLLLLSTLLFVFRRKGKMLQTSRAVPGLNLRIFTYKEIEEATNGFKEELGRGASSTVYKGVLKYESENLVAVKKLEKIIEESEQEFKAEMSSISRTNHKNLVQLLGYCNEGQHRILVYEYMRNGSIASLLFENPRPNWYTRVQVAFGTARGLHYLHEECSTQIIHCDIKPQNILLDESFTAKISDFGLAKLLKTDQTRTTTAIRGTRGYVAPEWFKSMPITVKVDVYSFGIFVLELICCRKNFETDVESENEMILSDWAYDCYKEGSLDLLVGNDDEALDDKKRLEKFVMIAIWCIQEDPSLRPTMKKVMQMLEGSVEVSTPPDPSSFISSI